MGRLYQRAAEALTTQEGTHRTRPARAARAMLERADLAEILCQAGFGEKLREGGTLLVCENPLGDRHANVDPPAEEASSENAEAAAPVVDGPSLEVVPELEHPVE